MKHYIYLSILFIISFGFLNFSVSQVDTDTEPAPFKKKEVTMPIPPKLSTTLPPVPEVKPYKILEGHTAGVKSVVFSPDGKMLASSGSDITIRLWQVSDGTFIKTIGEKGHKLPIYSLAFSPDGTTLVSGSSDNEIIIWRLEDDKDIKRLKKSEKGVNSIAFSPDGDYFASAHEDFSINIYKVEKWKHLEKLTGHTNVVSSITFSPDSKILASAGKDKIVKLWNTADLTPINKLTQPYQSAINCIAFNPNGQIIALGGTDKTISLIKFGDESIIRTIPTSDIPNAIKFSNDGQLLAVGNYDGTMQVMFWQIESDWSIKNINPRNGSINSISFSPDGKLIASGDDGNSVMLWKIEEILNSIEAEKKRSRLLTTWEHCIKDNTIESYKEFREKNPDTPFAEEAYKMEMYLAFIEAYKSNTIQAYQQFRKNYPDSPYDKDAYQLEVNYAFGLAQSVNLVEAYNEFIRNYKDTPEAEWSIQKVNYLKKEGFQYLELLRKDDAFAYEEFLYKHPETRYKAEINRRLERLRKPLYGEVTLTKLKDSPLVYDFVLDTTLTGHIESILCTAFNSDGKILATGSVDSTIKLWSITDKKEIKTLTGYNGINTISFSPDEDIIAIGCGNYQSTDNPIKLWNLKNESESIISTAHTGGIISIAFSPDGKIVATGSWDKTVKLSSVEDRKEIRTLTGHNASVVSVAFAPNGKMLASGCDDGTIKLWSVNDGKELKTLTLHKERISTLAFTPDGNILASGSWDKTIKFYSIPDGREIKTLVGHTDHILSIAFSPDGKMLASGSADNTIKIWSVVHGNEIKTLTGHSGGVFSVNFSPNGQPLVSSSGDKSIKLWVNSTNLSPILDITRVRFNDISTGGNGSLDAIEDAQLSITISNKGNDNAYRVRLYFRPSTSDIKLPYCFWVGLIPPEHNATAVVPISAYSGLKDGKASITIDTEEGNIGYIQAVEFEMPTRYAEPPTLTISPNVIINDKTPPGIKMADGTIISSPINGNGNGIIENDETVEIKLSIQNTGLRDAFGAKLVFTPLDFNIKIVGEREVDIGDIRSKTSKDGKFIISIPKNFNADSLRFIIKTVVGKVNIPVSEKSFALPYAKKSPALFLSYKIQDGTPSSTRSRGNANGSIEKEEIIDLSISLENKGKMEAKNVKVAMSINKDGVIVNESIANIGNIPIGGRSGIHSLLFTVQDRAKTGELPIEFYITQDDFPSDVILISFNIVDNQTPDIAVGYRDMKIGNMMFVKIPVESTGTIYSITSLPDNSNVLFSATEKRGILKSTNGGINWSNANNGLEDLSVNCISIAKDSLYVLYAGTTNKGIFKSTDGGMNWKAINQGIEATGMNINCITIDPTHSKTIYVGTKASGIYKSTDGGENWTQYIQGLPTTDVRCIAVDPNTPQNIYAGLGSGGLARSTDGGITFKVVLETNLENDIANSILSILIVADSKSSTIYVGKGKGGIYSSKDGGDIWNPTNNGLPVNIYINGNPFSVYSIKHDITNPSIIYALTRGGIYTSRDGGNIWIENNYGLINLPEIDLQTFFIDKTGKILIGSKGGIYSLSRIKEKHIIPDVNFDYNSDNLKSSAFTILDKIATSLNTNPSLKVIIEGHTDNIGTNSFNMDLSRRRARSIERYFVSKGVSNNRISTYGYGKNCPISSNEVEDGRAKNRRVEILVVE